MIKHAEIHKIKIENEIRYIAKVFIDREEIEDESFSSLTFEETAKHVLKECVISSYIDMTETEKWWKNKITVKCRRGLFISSNEWENFKKWSKM